MYNIIDSKNGQKIECSVVLEENKLNVVPKKKSLFVIVLILVCKRLTGKIFIMK